MKEREQILDLWQHLSPSSFPLVLATVVKTLGSSYRRPGARLLLTSDGRRAGSISGGCLEDDLIRKAAWLTEKGPAIRRYDTTPDGEISQDSAITSSGFGTGCNGVVYVYLERVSAEQPGILDLLEEVRATRHSAFLAQILSPAESVGQRVVVNGRGIVNHNLSDGRLVEKLLAQQVPRAANRVTLLDSGHEVFFETLVPPVRLLIFGAGDDAVPLTEMARQLGWHVSVFDGRAHYARREKFPYAHQVSVRCSDEPVSSLAIDPWTVAVTMTHSYAQDLSNLRLLHSHALAYIGVLGPRNRTLQLLAEAGLDASAASNIHSPMGLDIGADGSDQVALSVIAEIQATLNHREGGPLRAKSGSIHSHSQDGAAAPYVPSIVCA